jgi:hypothetical protein
MISIHNLSDLTVYGINPLTGEADRFSFRILCDLSSSGKTLVCDCLGLRDDCQFTDNWNSRVGDAPAIASIMLSPPTLWELARFALMTVEQCDVVIGDRDLCGIVAGETYYEQHILLANEHNRPVYRNYAKHSSAPGSGSRNEHSFTGRLF